MALKQKNVAEQEAKVYYNTYNQIYKQVEIFADSYGIGLVLRHNNVQMDPQKRDTVLQGVNRAIVFQRNLDITEEVIKRVNAANVAAAPAGTSASRRGGRRARWRNPNRRRQRRRGRLAIRPLRRSRSDNHSLDRLRDRVPVRRDRKDGCLQPARFGGRFTVEEFP
jgi:ribosomal protein L12E/L44/L45/RPP1/RPP2